MRTINITVRDKLPVVAAMSGTAVQDNKYKLLFDFDEEWQDGMKSVVVVGNRRQYVVYPTETNEVEIELGDARVVNVGVMQDVIATSRPCQIIVEESIKRRMGVEIVPPSDDMWTYITEQIRLLNAAKLSPVEKSDTMTQPVGRDAQGRLFTAPGGIKRLTVTENSDGRYSLVIVMTNGTEHVVQLPQLLVEMADSAPTETTAGDAGGLRFDKTSSVLYVCEGQYQSMGAAIYRWTPVGGGLPEFTDADEGKVLQITGSVATWSDAPAGGSVTVNYDETTGELTITSASGGVAYDETTGNLTIGG